MGGPKQKDETKGVMQVGKPAVKTAEPKTEPLRRHRKILFVDDLKLVLDLQRLKMKSIDKDIEVLCATSAAEALEILAGEGSVDLVVSDFNMAGMNGVELARKIKTDYPSVKVLLATVAPDEAKKEAAGMGDLKILGKPMHGENSVEEFYKAVMDALYNRK